MVNYFRLTLFLTVAWLSCYELLWDFAFASVEKKQKSTFITIKSLILKTLYFPLNFKQKNKKKKILIMPSDFPFVHLIQLIWDTSDEVRFAWDNSLQTRKNIKNQFKMAYSIVPHSDLILTALGTLSVAWFLRRSLHRYKNANDLPLSFFEGRQKKLKGLAVSVNDSDNIRFYHQPHLYSLFKPNLARQDLKYHTINIRLAGIDAPEVLKILLTIYYSCFRWHILELNLNLLQWKPRNG